MISISKTEIEEVIKECWDDMTPVRKIGSGAYGVVFECEKKAHGTNFITKEAVKLIKIPNDFEDDYDDELGMEPKEYFTKLKDKAVAEIQIMDQLKGPNVVHINEYKVIKQKEQFGFYILIRMDLLKNLKTVLKEHINDDAKKAEQMAIKVCKDMCSALGTCFEKNMVHRDIKPENILMSEKGDFYLGDFGLAREMSIRTKNLSSKGTEEYMAPESLLNGCNELTDLYSLGIVLYRIVNNNRAPFRTNENSGEDIENAQRMRLSGNLPVPLPQNCSEAFGKFVVKMCAYRPEDCFQSIDEIEKALERTDKKNGGTEIEPKSDRISFTQINNNQSINVNNISFNETNATVNEKGTEVKEKEKKPKQNKLIKAFIIALALIILVPVIFYAVILKIAVGKTKEKLATKQESTLENESLDEEASEMYLSSMKIVEGENAEIKSDVEDTLGNEYDNALEMYAYTRDAYATFYLEGKFERFTADFSCLEHDFIMNNDFRLEIFGDDENEILYSLDYSRAVAVTSIDIDVSDVEFLTIRITGDNGDTKGGIISNGLLKKQE